MKKGKTERLKKGKTEENLQEGTGKLLKLEKPLVFGE